MTSERLYNLCYGALKVFHWALLFIVVEAMFWCAGWVLFGSIGSFLSWALIPDSHQQNGVQGILNALPVVGKYFGLVAGIVFMRVVTVRYKKSDDR